ncbi:pilus assembly protein TadE [Janibacter terrae]|uniref:Pilus assembly protein TadE n=1 Tax=Janibacter terrae TaxID=103817 RepID=A0ABZ2FCR0_9MICO|nr:TadE family type IV pilus minor pilin [Janibacter terrae]HCE60056.1 pilus assembly protein TadE [Janibacter terrae]
MVTAELALTIPAVVLVLVICLSALSWGVDRVRCVDAARVAVRELARGESPSRALTDAQRTAPDGARLEVGRSGSDVTVTVTAPSPPALAFAAAETSCSSTARLESVDVAP